MELSPLERDALNWIAQHANDAALTRQLDAVEAVQRRFTGVGSFTELLVPADLPRVSFRVCPINPLIESSALEHGGDSVLFFEDGLASTLELYAFVGSFPEAITAWKLSPWRKPPAAATSM